MLFMRDAFRKLVYHDMPEFNIRHSHMVIALKIMVESL